MACQLKSRISNEKSNLKTEFLLVKRRPPRVLERRGTYPKSIVYVHTPEIFATGHLVRRLSSQAASSQSGFADRLTSDRWSFKEKENNVNSEIKALFSRPTHVQDGSISYNSTKESRRLKQWVKLKAVNFSLATKLQANTANCPLCKEEPQTIEHWLRRCPRLDAIRQNRFGRLSPLLYVLTTDSERILARARVILW